MRKFCVAVILTVVFSVPVNAFMLGSDVTEMVTAPFSMHRTNGNEAMPRFMQKATEMFEPEDEEVDLSTYSKMIQEKVKSNFKPPQIEGSPSVVVLFKISHRGKLESYKVIKSSGDDLYDHAAVRAIQMSAPFDYLPSGYDKELLKVQFTFSKNIMSVNCF